LDEVFVPFELSAPHSPHPGMALVREKVEAAETKKKE
jgi:hypothetical protein